MVKLSVSMNVMNNLLSNMVLGVDSKSNLMRSFGRKFLRVTTHNSSLSLIGHRLLTGKTFICQPMLAQIHLLKLPDLHRLLIKSNQFQDIGVILTLNKHKKGTNSENRPVQI